MPLSEEAQANLLRSYGRNEPLWQHYLLDIGIAVTLLVLLFGNTLRWLPTQIHDSTTRSKPGGG